MIRDSGLTVRVEQLTETLEREAMFREECFMRDCVREWEQLKLSQRYRVELELMCGEDEMAKSLRRAEEEERRWAAEMARQLQQVRAARLCVETGGGGLWERNFGRLFGRSTAAAQTVLASALLRCPSAALPYSLSAVSDPFPCQGGRCCKATLAWHEQRFPSGDINASAIIRWMKEKEYFSTAASENTGPLPQDRLKQQEHNQSVLKAELFLEQSTIDRMVTLRQLRTQRLLRQKQASSLLAALVVFDQRHCDLIEVRRHLRQDRIETRQKRQLALTRARQLAQRLAQGSAEITTLCRQLRGVGQSEAAALMLLLAPPAHQEPPVAVPFPVPPIECTVKAAGSNGEVVQFNESSSRCYGFVRHGHSVLRWIRELARCLRVQEDRWRAEHQAESVSAMQRLEWVNSAAHLGGGGDWMVCAEEASDRTAALLALVQRLDVLDLAELQLARSGIRFTVRSLLLLLLPYSP